MMLLRDAFFKSRISEYIPQNFENPKYPGQ